MTPLFYLRKLKQISRFAILQGLFPLLLWANSDLLTTTQQAERLFSEQLYHDALPLYSHLLTFSPEEEMRVPLTLRLAACYLEKKQPQATLALLAPLKSSLYRPQSLYLMSLAHRQRGEFSLALGLLQQIPALQNSQPAQGLIALEKGYHLFHLGDWSTAQLLFESIPKQTPFPLAYALAQLHLAKIFFLKHQFDASLQILFLLEDLPSHHPLSIEIFYFKGWLLLAQHQNIQAMVCFEHLLPKALSAKTEVSTHILKGLMMCYLQQALVESSPDQLQILLSKAETTLQQLLKYSPTETSYLLLSDFYLIKAKRLSDPQAYAHAQQLLDRQDLFSSQEALQQALLKRAEAAPSYQERSQLYQHLATQSDYRQAFCAKAWFFKGLNDVEQGLTVQKQHPFASIAGYFEQAAHAFNQAFQLGHPHHPRESALSLKLLALAYIYQTHPQKTQQAWQVINELMANSSLMATFEAPQEIACLSAWIALHLHDPSILRKAQLVLQQGEKRGKPLSIWQERGLKLEGLICLKLEEWQQADKIFTRLLQDFPHFSSQGEAWFWRAYCAEKQHSSLQKEYLQQVYTQDPQSPYAPLAYFRLYSYHDYLQGQRKAIKHLQAMSLLFPSHPLLIQAYYLMGLSHKKDHFSEEGQLVRRKDWTAAIEAFQSAESTFDALLEKNRIPPEDLSHFTQVRYRSQLERAEANFAIAQHSTGGKKQIYLEYAEGVFKQLLQAFTDSDSLVREKLLVSPYPKTWAEAEFKLAQVYEEKKGWKEAEQILNASLTHYQHAQTTHGYGLMRVWYEKGKLAQKQTEARTALHCFIEAEKATQDSLRLSPHEKLDLWIQQSLCYKALDEWDHAMRLLSRVINEDVISPLRIKAMFLRAELYELQGRSELAIKQLEATANKGGEWAQKAKEKLEKDYGY